MPGSLPNPIRLFRIVHKANIPHLLRYGIVYREHFLADPDYIHIGDLKLIENRHNHPVRVVPPGGSLGEYVPFYFGPLSPMLLRIRNGTGVVQRPQEDIVYICCNLTTVLENCAIWCFTDGHAKKSISTFYNKLEDLDKVDWDMVKQKWWHNTEEDTDRERRKQAEFLVYDRVPVNCISGLIVYNEATAEDLRRVVEEANLAIPVVVRPSFYY